MKRLSEIEADKAREVEAFYEAHPEMRDPGDRAQHERHWVGDRNETTLPMDPTLLAEMNLTEEPHAHTATQAEKDVEAAFQRIRPQDVEVLQRRYVEQMTLDAIAAEEGVSRQAILKRLETAKKHLREAVSELDT